MESKGACREEDNARARRLPPGGALVVS
jgi:hypothetical protein